MLCELRVENLLLIEQAELQLAAGLNVLTGETGAGKTVLAHALDLLMGGRARNGIVRPGAQEAYVEGVFSIDMQLSQELAGALPENVSPVERPSRAQVGEGGPAGASGGEVTLTLARRVTRDGRTRAYLNGRSAGVGDLRALGSRLLSFYGQHEHRKLTLAGAQLEILDRACGEQHLQRVRECEAAYLAVRRIESELERVRQLTLTREQELALVEHEIAEIEQAAPDERDYAELLERRERLRRLDALKAALGAAVEALTGESDEGLSASQSIAMAAAQLGGLRGVDARLDELGERCEALAIEAQDVAGELCSYREGLDEEQGSLGEVEERLDLLGRLMRKHGGTVASVIEHLGQARARREELAQAQDSEERLCERLGDARALLERHVGELRSARRRAARMLEKGVRAQLAALAMGEASFDVKLTEVPARASGGDEPQFVVAPNRGVAAAPLREIASGGELSRVMLALATVSAAGSRQRAASTLVFDEIDAGIGGHTARAVGERLRDLAKRRQLLCITHLPQIASLADRHFSVVKHSSADGTTTSVVRLGEAEVLAELVRMLGADERDPGAREHAAELLRAA